MVCFVRQLPPEQKLALYKKVKGYFLYEGYWTLNDFKCVLNEKAIDVHNALDYDIVDYMEVYKDYSYGRY